ncbi:MAG: hypothetical protein ABIP21_05485 [Acidimicrobiia bacterium]
MLHRVGVASAFAVTASLVSGIAAIAMTTGPTVITALPARAATAAPVGTVDARVRADGGARLVGSTASTNATPTASSSDAKIVTAFWAAVSASSEVEQSVPANSGPAPSTPHQPSSGTRPPSPTSPSTNPPPSTPPTTAPNPSPPPYTCAGSDDGMTEAYKHAREQYCRGGDD